MQINTLSTNFGTCAQISSDDLAEIAHLGYRTVINFRPDSEGGAEQPLSQTLKTQAESLGLQYFHIPVIPNQIQVSQVAQCATILKSTPQPILGFCRTGNRAANVYQLALAQI